MTDMVSVGAYTVGRRMREVRKCRGLTQSDFAGLIGVDQAKVSRMERSISMDSLFGWEIAIALGVDRNWLLFGEGPDPIINDVRLEK